MSPASFIAKKRDGGEHRASDLEWMVASFLSGDFTDYQMTAWLMAVYLRGLTMEETLGLTGAMLHSGAVLDKKRSSRSRIDKHSTGGVGDKVSLPLAPLCAACGLDVPMIAGRGLGHTGGTLDKLESIPGFSVKLSVNRFERVVAKVGAAIMGQTEELAPADRRMYALRDVTGTVACRPLIVASILSKKLAESLDGLVLDVKVGRGAFMSDAPSARRLAKDLVAVSGELGTPAVARLSNMHQPLGAAIGNALEVRESLAVLRGQGPSDTRELTLALAADMCLLGGVERTLPAARRRAEQVLDGGFALERFAQMIDMQGGDARVVDDPRRLPTAPQRMIVRCQKRGFVSQVDPLRLAELALDLGAGRKRAQDTIDHAVGVELHVRVGNPVAPGTPLCTLHVRRRAAALPTRALGAFSFSASPVASPALLLGRALRSSPQK